MKISQKQIKDEEIKDKIKLEGYIKNSETEEDFQRRILLCQGFLYYKKKLSELQLEIQRVNDENHNLYNENSRLKVIHQEITTKSYELRKKLRSQEKEDEINELNEKITELKKIKSQFSVENNSLKHKIFSLQCKLEGNQLINRLERAEKFINYKKERIIELETELEELKLKIGTI